MASYYDDNYGHWEGMDEEENREHYRRTQATNVWKKCRGCGKRVKIQPQYGYCNACATARERGVDY